MEKIEELVVLDEEEIEKEALRHYHWANQERVRGMLETARRKMAISWGLFSYLEYVPAMTRCTRSLRKMGLTSEGVVLYQNQGYGCAIRILSEKSEG